MELVRGNYQAIASEFDVSRQGLFWPEIAKFAALVPENSRVLDAGCGNGRLLLYFKDKKISYLGFDSSQALIDLAKKNQPKHEFILGDLLEEENSIPTQSFDYVFCLAVWHHIPSQDLRLKALLNLKNYLKPGGTIFLSVWDLKKKKGFAWKIFLSHLKAFFGLGQLEGGDLLFAWKGEKKSARYYHAFNKRELQKISHRADLKVDKLYTADNNYYLILKKN